MAPITHKEQRADNIVYLADVRRRLDPNDGSSDPPAGAGAARPYELAFLRAVAVPEVNWHCAA